MDPKSATGIVAFGNASPEVTAAAAALVATTSMVASLPAAGTDGAATAKAAAKKTTVAKDDAHVLKRQTLIDSLGLKESYENRYTREGETVPPSLLEKIANGNKELSAHDKKFAQDNSVKTIVELTQTFAELDNKVKDIELRILEGVVSLQHEIATRELQLGKLVVEGNQNREKRRIARA